MNKNYASLLPSVLALARQAAKAIMNVRGRQDYLIRQKIDQSPVTEADLLAHDILEEGLSKLTPDIPILSEEGETIPLEMRKNWPVFWLIDPLDGTKEFIRGSEDFTVNIALIYHHRPILGVVGAPALEQYYWASEEGAFFQEKTETIKKLKTAEKVIFPIKVALSRSSTGEQAKWRELINRFKQVEFIYRGSALKICLVAKGEVDLYPRLGPTGEWDTAAGQCILEQAGGKLVDLWGRAFQYNARETLVNEGFFAVGCPELLSYLVENPN